MEILPPSFHLFSDSFCKMSLACQWKNGTICWLCKQLASCRGFFFLLNAWEGWEAGRRRMEYFWEAVVGEISLPMHYPWHFLCQPFQGVLYSPVSNIGINLHVRKKKCLLHNMWSEGIFCLVVMCCKEYQCQFYLPIYISSPSCVYYARKAFSNKNISITSRLHS